MKVKYSLAQIRKFLEKQGNVNLESVQKIPGGKSSQAIIFKDNLGKEFVLRIRETLKEFQLDLYAYKNFRKHLPIPSIFMIGALDDNSFYCISEYIQGKSAYELESVDFESSLDSIYDLMARTFNIDISKTTGYGNINPETGDGSFNTWKESLENEIDTIHIKNLKLNSLNLGIETALIDSSIDQFKKNLPFVVERRRLLHGDTGGSNMIIEKNKVAALIDWEYISYGDWLRDFSRLTFWGIKDYGNPLDFANKYNLETENIQERMLVYWAMNTLKSIEFACINKHSGVIKWLEANAKIKVLLNNHKYIM